MLVRAGLAVAPASTALSLFALVLLLVDTGNIPWFVMKVWKDEGFWA